MNYGLTEEQLALRDIARRIAREKVRPVAAKHDREGTFPWDMVKIFADTGFYASYISEEYGGCGGGVLELALITEELSRACGGIALALAATALGTFPIMIAGSEEQKKRYLPRLATGEIYEKCLNSSRLNTFDKCTSIVGNFTATMASLIATLVCV